jgi:small GTP-binding protein
MSINKNLFQRVQGIILMYDITNEESFNSLGMWMEHIKENSNGSPIILIGNKNDLINDRKVPKEKGETFAKDNDIIFLEASAKSGSNVDECFIKLGQDIIQDENFIVNKEKSKNEYIISKNTSSKKKKNCC